VRDSECDSKPIGGECLLSRDAAAAQHRLNSSHRYVRPWRPSASLTVSATSSTRPDVANPLNRRVPIGADRDPTKTLIMALNERVSSDRERGPGSMLIHSRFDCTVPGLVQEAFSESGPLRVPAPACAGAPAAGQTATDQNRMGDRFQWNGSPSRRKRAEPRRPLRRPLSLAANRATRATTELTVAGGPRVRIQLSATSAYQKTPGIQPFLVSR
jgi:hypothetical protein